MRIAWLPLLIASPYLLQPAPAQTISVVNDASGLPGIVPGSLARISLYQLNGPISALDPSTVSVHITQQDGSIVDAQIVSVPASAFLIARIPSGLATGSATVTLQSNGTATLQTAVNVLATNFGIYSQTPARLTRPALPGDFITLWGTGLGKYSDASVLIGGHPTAITYIGPAPGSPGLDQINVQVPADAAIPNDCSVALQFRADGTASNVISLPKANAPGICQSSIGLSADEISQLDAGRRVIVGRFTIGSLIAPPIPNPAGSSTSVNRQEYAQGYFTDIDGNGLGQMSAPLVAEDVYNSCSAGQFGLAIGRLFRVGLLDAGDKLVLSGPVATFDVPAVDITTHFAYGFNPPPSSFVADPTLLPPPVFGPGNWVLSDPVGKDVLPFQQPFLLPRQILVDKVTVGSTINHLSEQTFTWDASGYAASDTALITLQGTISVPAWFNGFTSYSVSCRVPAATGRVTMPAALLAPFGTSAVGSALTIWVTPRPDRQSTFRIPLTGGGSVPGLLTYQFYETIPVTIQ